MDKHNAFTLPRKSTAFLLGIGLFYLIGGFFILLMKGPVFMPLIEWVKNAPIVDISWYLSLWARISILTGSLLIGTVSFLHKRKS